MKDVLEYKGFTGYVHFTANDQVFFGKVEEVDDLITFEGSTINELKEAFQYAVDRHILN
jgi:predicted HicB family RNase H-like nuclease